MTAPGQSPSPSVPPAPEFGDPATLAARLAIKQRAGGIIVPIVTVVFALVLSIAIVAATQHSLHTALLAFQEIFNGTGLNWLAHPTTNLQDLAAYNLSQTLLQTSTLILTGLAVAFAFRCGMFNIGGQGQYFIGLIVANWIGVSFASMSPLPHILLAVVGGTLAAAAYAGIAGVLKATVGAHEVITTIMLNWIAIWGGQWLVEAPNGHLHGPVASLPRSAVIFDSAKLWPLWGVGPLALSAAIFVALAGLVVYYLVLNRTTLGFGIRAVGFNPEAARYSGIPVRRSYFLALGIAGAFAGLAGAVDVLGAKFAVDTSDFATQIGFTGIAVALLGRNKAVGIFFAALLFAGLQTGTSTRALDPSIFDPALATDLATMIQALVIFFVGAELLFVFIWRARRYLRLRRAPREEPAPL